MLIIIAVSFGVSYFQSQNIMLQIRVVLPYRHLYFLIKKLKKYANIKILTISQINDSPIESTSKNIPPPQTYHITQISKITNTTTAIVMDIVIKNAIPSNVFSFVFSLWSASLSHIFRSHTKYTIAQTRNANAINVAISFILYICPRYCEWQSAILTYTS